LIYITDGIGKAVETAPPFPVIWVLASDSKHTLPHELDPPASFGLALPLHIAS
jgi:predicted metal-dependent peptidase